MRFLVGIGVISILCTAVAGSQQPVERAPRSSLMIVEPAPDAVFAGQSILRAEVAPEAGLVTSVEFYVDGVLACAVNGPPYECTFDAGPRIAERLIRAVANFAAGNRAVETVRTRTFKVAETTGADAVLVPVIVTDWQGRFASNLPREAFRVFEDGVLQTVTSLQAENVPVDIVVAVDISGSMADSMPKMKQIIKGFLKSLKKIDHVTIMAFNDRTYIVAKRDVDPVARISAIDALTAFGRTSIYDAILQALDQFGREISRKAIVVFTDGDDRNSLAPSEQVEKRIHESEATIYMITQGNGAQVQAVSKVVDRLSQISGGRAFTTEKADQLQKVLELVLEDLTHQYLIGYSSTNTAHDGSYRKITVTTSVNSNQIRAREGYRAPVR